MAYTVGPKGQIVVSKEIRDRLGIKPGWLALQRVVDDHVEVYFVPPEHRRSLKGSLASYLKAKIPSGEKWNRAREKAWEKAAKEKTDSWGNNS